MNILIAEDEKIERESLVAIISESMLEIDNLYVVENGLQLIEQFEKVHVDIILVDINMPIMDGLTAIAHIRKKYPERYLGILVLTSYDHFLYAQEAIRLGIDEFLLKPLHPERLIAIISKLLSSIKEKQNGYTQTKQLIEKVDEMRSTIEMQCLYGIITNMDATRLERLFALLHYRVTSAICFIFPVQCFEILNIMKQQINDFGYYCLLMNYRSRLIFYVLYCEELQIEDVERLKQFLYMALPKYLIICSDVKLFNERFYHAYLEASKLYWEIYEAGDKLIVRQETADDDIVTQLLEAKKNHDIKQITTLVHGYLLHQWKIHQVIDQDEVNLMLKKLIDKLHEENLGTEYHNGMTWQYTGSSLLQDIEYDLVTFIDHLFTSFTTVSNTSKNFLIQKALLFIETNYQKPIGLEDVAKALKVTPAYVSRLLSKSKYPSFSELVSDCRIKEAKKLLQENYRMKEICYKVGFQSQSYFTKIFRKKVGVTPKEYRDKHIHNEC